VSFRRSVGASATEGRAIKSFVRRCIHGIVRLGTRRTRLILVIKARDIQSNSIGKAPNDAAEEIRSRGRVR
jgi:hypothetical protein